MSRQDKKDILSSIINSIDGEVNFALVHFHKLSHQNMEKIRVDLQKVGAKLSVVKNSMFEKAINKLSQKNKLYSKIKKDSFPIRYKSGLLTFKSSWFEGLKAFYQFSKNNENLSLEVGVFDQIGYDKESINSLATLPSKNELLSKLLMVMQNPIAKTTQIMNSPFQKLLYILSQKIQKLN